MKKTILLAAVVLIVCGVIFLVSLSHIVESARENIDNDKPCDSYETLKWTSFFSSESKYLLGTIYSKGICSVQDVHQAKELYASIYGSDTERIARALFHDAIQLSDFYERTQLDRKPENIRSLLVESKNLAFKPSDRELEDLKKRTLLDVFMESP